MSEEDEWAPYTGKYLKSFYDIKLKDGRIIRDCWPNNGKFRRTDGFDSTWGPSDIIQIRKKNGSNSSNTR